MVDPDTTLSVSVGEDGVKTVEQFDEYFSEIDESYSRAGRIKEGMGFYRAIHEVICEMDDVPDPDDLGHYELKSWVRQALLDKNRLEAAGEI